MSRRRKVVVPNHQVKIEKDGRHYLIYFHDGNGIFAAKRLQAVLVTKNLLVKLNEEIERILEDD